MRELFKEFLKCIFPIFCVLCRKKGKIVCRRCVEDIVLLDKMLLCRLCFLQQPDIGFLCHNCHSRGGKIKTEVLFDESVTVTNLIRECREGSREIASLFAEKVIEFIHLRRLNCERIGIIMKKTRETEWLWEIGKIISKRLDWEIFRIHPLKKSDEKKINGNKKTILLGESFEAYTYYREILSNLFPKETFNLLFVY